MGYYSRKYRAKSVDEIPNQTHGNRKLEIFITLVTIAVTTFFLVSTINAMQEIQNIPENPEPDIMITGHQWWWEAEYPDDSVVTANIIHIPVGKKVLLKLNSADVIHSWWVPKLARKMDMIPGRDNYLEIRAEKEGEYLGSCSEFCGTQHGRMRIRVIVQNQKDFEAWKKHQKDSATRTGSALFLKGQRLFQVMTCATCHTIKGTSAQGTIGPNLTHFASRSHFLTDLKITNKENLRAWLENPQKIKSSAKMPNDHLSEEELEALVAYVYGLK